MLCAFRCHLWISDFQVNLQFTNEIKLDKNVYISVFVLDIKAWRSFGYFSLDFFMNVAVTEHTISAVSLEFNLERNVWFIPTLGVMHIQLSLKGQRHKLTLILKYSLRELNISLWLFSSDFRGFLLDVF